MKQRISENIKPVQRKKSPIESTTIITCLKNHFVFYNLSEAELENVREKMFWCQVDEGQQIFQQGSQTNCFFIVNRGKLEQISQGLVKKTYKQNDGFGEIAMLYKTQRNSTVKAVQRCQLWVIDRHLFKQAVEQIIIQEFQQNRKCLENLRFFSGLSREHKDLITSSLLTKKFMKNQTIIKEGDPGSCFYYIKDGYASAFKGSKLVKKLMKGDSFGEQSLYYNTMRQLSVKADEQCTILILPRDTLYKIMGEDIYQVTFKNFIRWSLQACPLFQNLKKSEIELMIQKMKLSSYKMNETIFRKGVSGFQKVVVVIEGQLKNTRNGAIVASKGQCYGQEYMLSQKRNQVMEEQIIMNSYGVLAELTDYKIIQDINLDQVLKKSDGGKLKRAFSYTGSSQKQQLYSIKLHNLMMVQQIKMGQFGPIYLVKNQVNTLFALRCLKKKMIQQFEVEQFILSEQKIFSNISHPFICGLGKKFQSKNYIFQVMEYVDGKDLDNVMDQIGLFSSKDCQFYAACIISILQYLYENGIIARDIKPQNFMVDSEGYLKLINMAVGKKVGKQGKSLTKTYTIIGTPHYMAPDIILGKGYNNMVDIWSLGIMMFQFMCGELPFGNNADNAYEIYEQIMRNQLRFPQYMIDKRAKKLIQQFLSHNPETRLDGSFENIKSNSWFHTINWQKLESKTLSPQFIPIKPKKRVFRQGPSVPLLGQLKQIEQEQSMKMSEKFDEKQQAEKWKSFDEYIN